MNLSLTLAPEQLADLRLALLDLRSSDGNSIAALEASRVPRASYDGYERSEARMARITALLAQLDSAEIESPAKAPVSLSELGGTWIESLYGRKAKGPYSDELDASDANGRPRPVR
jgi:hypothetical protein